MQKHFLHAIPQANQKRWQNTDRISIVTGRKTAPVIVSVSF
jgi:hypothetical protein